MCGIAGLIHKGKKSNVGSEMTAMLQALKHRGPDSTGYAVYSDGNSGDLVIMSPFTNRYLNTSCVPKPRTNNPIKYLDYNALVLKPRANKGVFFNSNLMHYVDINRSSKDRVSVAFHILVHG